MTDITGIKIVEKNAGFSNSLVATWQASDGSTKGAVVAWNVDDHVGSEIALPQGLVPDGVNVAFGIIPNGGNNVNPTAAIADVASAGAAATTFMIEGGPNDVTFDGQAITGSGGADLLLQSEAKNPDRSAGEEFGDSDDFAANDESGSDNATDRDVSPTSATAAAGERDLTVSPLNSEQIGFEDLADNSDGDFNDLIIEVVRDDTPPLVGSVLVDDGVGNIGRVDLSTGDYEVIGPSGVLLFDIALAPTGDLFGLTSSAFYSVDIETGQASFIGNHGVAGLNALDFAPDGTLYAAGSSSANLYELDVSTGQASVLGDVGSSSAGDLQYDEESDQLYFAGPNAVYEIDPTDGFASEEVIDLTGLPEDIYGLGFDDNGDLFGFGSSGGIYRLDPDAGTADETAQSSASFFGAATPTSDDPGFEGGNLRLTVTGPTIDTEGFSIEAEVSESGVEFPLLPEVIGPVGTVVAVQIDLFDNVIDYDFSQAGSGQFTSIPGGFNGYVFDDIDDSLPAISGVDIIDDSTSLELDDSDIGFTEDRITINVESLLFNSSTTLQLAVEFDDPAADAALI